MAEEKIGEAELARWMGYAKSRTQLVGYLNETDNRTFRIDYLGRIGAQLKKDPVELLGLLQIFAAEQRGKAKAPAFTPPLSGPGAAEIEADLEQAEQKPVALKAKSRVRGR